MRRPLQVLLVTAVILIAMTPARCEFTDEQIDSLKRVAEQEGWTWIVGRNEGLQGTLEERCGLRRPDNWADLASFDPCTPTIPLPSSWDWRQMGGVTPIRNQGGCGSCWAFSAVGALECNIRIKDGLILDLSEQYLVSCNQLGFNCVDGGWWAHSYHLHESNPEYLQDICGGWGPVMEPEFPYAAFDLPCECPYTHVTERSLSGWGYIGEEFGTPTVEQIKMAIMQYGPVSVAVLATAHWDIYYGGIFNYCPILEPGDINHAVVLVGWNDESEVGGYWILRNSWGSNWGEDGYMRIAYGCMNVGYNATYVDYKAEKAYFWADNIVGWAPHDVNFDAFSLQTIDSWNWDFGDGGTSSEQTPPTHTYTGPGSYDVTLEVTSGGETYTLSKPMYIVAIADTVKAPESSGQPGDQVEVVISANNSAPVRYFKIPVEFGGDLGLTYTGLSTQGCRTDYFEVQDYLHYDPWFGKRLTLKLVSSTDGSQPELEPGSGPIAKLYFTVSSSAVAGQSTVIQLDGYDEYVPAYYGSAADYEVASVDGLVSLGCCLSRGDVNDDGDINAADLHYLVSHLHKSGDEPPCFEQADVNGDGLLDAKDVSCLARHLYSPNNPCEPVECP